MPLYNVNLNISESGKIVELLTLKGRPIAEFYCDAPLIVAAYNAVNEIPEKPGRVNIFRGEILMLQKGEILDKKNEVLIEAVNEDIA